MILFALDAYGPRVLLRALVRIVTVYYLPLCADGSLPLSQKTGIFALSGAVFATISATYGGKNGPSAVVVAPILLMISFLASVLLLCASSQ